MISIRCIWGKGLGVISGIIMMKIGDIWEIEREGNCWYIRDSTITVTIANLDEKSENDTICINLWNRVGNWDECGWGCAMGIYWE